MARISSQIRLAEHAALACVRDCVADLEKTSESISAAGLFQVRQQESKAGEQGMYRKSGECAGLRKAAGQHQAAVSFFGQRGCAVLAGGNALFGELARTRTPPLCPSAHHSPSRARRTAQDCCGKANRCALLSSCSVKLLMHADKRLPRGRHLSEARRASAGRASPRLAGLRGRREAWTSSWLSWSAPCMPSMQPKHTAPLHPLFGRAGDRFRTSDACMHGR